MAETTTTEVVNAEAQAADNTHLMFVISQETYDIMKELAERASGRGLNDSVQYWLESSAVKHAKVQDNLWDRADDAAIFQRAQKGNKQAIKALLASIGLKDVDPMELAKLVAKK